MKPALFEEFLAACAHRFLDAYCILPKYMHTDTHKDSLLFDTLVCMSGRLHNATEMDCVFIFLLSFHFRFIIYNVVLSELGKGIAIMNCWV